MFVHYKNRMKIKQGYLQRTTQKYEKGNKLSTGKCSGYSVSVTDEEQISEMEIRGNYPTCTKNKEVGNMTEVKNINI